MDSKTLLLEANSIKEQIIMHRKYIHSHAETGFDIENTFAYVKAELIKMGYEPQKCGRAGIVATVGGKKDGKVFLLRAEMDALPIEEKADVDFASTNGCMHACGHDMHSSMLLGAAYLLKQHEEEINGTIKLMFQPAEELFEGSKDMINDGLLTNPKVDAAMMIHVMAGMPFEAGTIIVSNSGVSAPAADYFEIKVKGKGCHGSMPNMGVDPLTAAAHILLALQEINARELAMSDKAVLTVGTIHAGNAANAIADYVTMGGSLRTYDEETRTFIKERMSDIVVSVAKAFRAEGEIDFGSGCPTLTNDKNMAADMYEYIFNLLGQDKCYTVEQLNSGSENGGNNKFAGSEDFAYISQQVPAIMLALAAGQPEKGYKYPQHHPMVKFDNDALDIGSAVYAYGAMRWLEEHK